MLSQFQILSKCRFCSIWCLQYNYVSSQPPLVVCVYCLLSIFTKPLLISWFFFLTPSVHYLTYPFLSSPCFFWYLISCFRSSQSSPICSLGSPFFGYFFTHLLGGTPYRISSPSSHWVFLFGFFMPLLSVLCSLLSVCLWARFPPCLSSFNVSLSSIHIFILL